MRPLSLSLRGNIGVKIGTGLDEINIDFSQFSPGLVVIAGETGSGKTSIIDNLQPFRTAPFHGGKLEDQFYLEKSHKEFKFEHNGKVYTSKLLINGKSGKSEAYVFEEGNPNPLNTEGKVSTHDKVMQEICGEPDIFFKSSFSKQITNNPFVKNKDLLDQNKLRELFNQIFDNDKYINWNEVSKETQKLFADKYNSVESEIRILREQTELIKLTEDDIQIAVAERTDKQHIYSVTETLIEQIHKNLEEKKIKLAGYESKVKEFDELKQKKDKLTREKQEIELNARTEVKAKESLRDNELTKFDEDNEYEKQIKELRTEKEIAREKTELEKNKIDAEIAGIIKKKSEYSEKIAAAEKEIKKFQKTIELKEQIEETLEKKKKLTEKLNMLMQQEKNLVERKSELQNGKEGETKRLRDLENGINETKREVEKITELVERKKFEITEKESELSKLTEDNKEILTVIDGKPCDADLAPKCPVLKYVEELTENIPSVKENIEKEIHKLTDQLEAGNTQLEELNHKLEDEQIRYEEAEKSLFDNYSAKMNEIDTQVKNIGGEIKSITSELAEINKHNWEEGKANLDKADNAIKVEQNSIDNFTEHLSILNKQLKEKEDTKIVLQQELDYKIESLKKQIDTANQLMRKERERLENDYTNEIKRINLEAEEKKVRIDREVKEIEDKIDNDIQSKIIEQKEKIRCDEEELKYKKELLQTTQTEINELNNKIAEIKQQLTAKQSGLDKIKSLEAQKQFYAKHAKEYMLLEKAFGKTGIPLLKIEHSGPEVTDTSNELLAPFENPFKVDLVTTERTKNNTVKEVFKIKVLENDLEVFQKKNGQSDLDDKSGGEQSVISTALQLAISIMAKKQGQQYETLYLDEKDGQLGSEYASQYYKMLNQVHKLAGVYYTIVISHKREVIDMIPQRIEMSKEGVKIVSDAA